MTMQLGGEAYVLSILEGHKVNKPLEYSKS